MQKTLMRHLAVMLCLVGLGLSGLTLSVDAQQPQPEYPLGPLGPPPDAVSSQRPPTETADPRDTSDSWVDPLGAASFPRKEEADAMSREPTQKVDTPAPTPAPVLATPPAETPSVVATPADPVPQPEAKPVETPAATPEAPTTETATPVTPPQSAPATPQIPPDESTPATATTLTTPPPAVADAVILALRAKLAGSPPANANRDNLAALSEFYATYTGPALWVASNGFSDKGLALIAEIAKAADWGLEASAFPLPAAPPAGASVDVLAQAEIDIGLAALLYARQAKGGRLDPTTISQMFQILPKYPDPKTVIRDLAASASPDEVLRSQHPQNPAFLNLRLALLAARTPVVQPTLTAPPRVMLPPGPLLKPGMQHPQVAILRERLAVTASAGVEETFDDVLAAAVKQFQRENGLAPDAMVGNGTRNVLNGVPNEAPPTREKTIDRIVINMERWRWMPDDLGAFHVENNIPEFQTRVFKDGEVIHSERIIVGKTVTPTPIFSANMKHVVFHPEWGVPDSIKVNELRPFLRPSNDFFSFGATDTRVLQRHNLRVVYNGRPVNPETVDWNSVDIRQFTFIQPPGPTNVLGVVKFLFPNKNDVYMHDTPQRDLFTQQKRMFSHGCIRVQNPLKLAEVLLAEDKGMTRADVDRYISGGSNTKIDLEKQVPVHIVYFTATADADGKITNFQDIYGLDGRMALAMTGRSLPPEATSSDDEQSAATGPPAKRKRPPPQSNPVDDLFNGLFSN